MQSERKSERGGEGRNKDTNLLSSQDVIRKAEMRGRRRGGAGEAESGLEKREASIYFAFPCTL